MEERCNAIYQHISNTIEGMFEIAKESRLKDFDVDGLSDKMVDLIHELYLVDREMFYLDERRCHPKF